VTLSLRVLNRLADFPASDWDALFPSGYPFTRHAFLSALEQSGCVGGNTGWDPVHLVLLDGGQAVAAMPLYAKHHSWGEFVFDHSWAQAAARLGEQYYPRLVSAVPFVPSTGPRMGGDTAHHPILLEAAEQIARDNQLSSAHLLFPSPEHGPAASDCGWLERHNIQFHWQRSDETDFAGFVARLTSEKRKKLLRERRRVEDAGIHFETRQAYDLSDAERARVYALYANTYEERGQPPYLTEAFFELWGSAAESPLKVILAHKDKRIVAMALTVQGNDTLYGRHWGAEDSYHSLHFECCYHQGIELCIQQRLSRYDAGAQGEHKLQRGFLPVITRSYHHLVNRRLSTAVADFLEQERSAVAERYQLLLAHSPYRQGG